MAEHVRVRDGLPGLAARLATAACRIGYLGASVTAQKDGYRPRLHDWLVRHFGRDHRAVIAATGGVGSVSAVFTMDDLLVRHRPHLCLVDYSSADLDPKNTPADRLVPVLEGMVRKLRDVGAAPCFLHLFRTDRCVGAPSEVLEAYERVAEHYGVPSIDVGARIASELAAGRYAVPDLLRDVVHTTPRGSDVTAEIVAGGLRELLDAGPGADRSQDAALPYLTSRSFHHTEVVPVAEAMLADTRRARRGRFRLVYDFLELASDNEIACAVDGELTGLMVVVGRDAGVIEVRGPGGARRYQLWDPSCHYDRYSTVVFDPPYPPRAAVRIRLTDAPIDYSTCRRPLEDAEAIQKRLKIIGFMVRHGRDLPPPQPDAIHRPALRRSDPRSSPLSP